MLRRFLQFAIAAAFFWPIGSTRLVAAGPQHFVVDVDQIQTLGLCGFPIVRHDVGTLQFVDYFDDSGGIVFENAIFTDWRITFTNPANGKSVESVRAYNERFVQYGDGSFKAVSAGLVAHLVVPGEGQVGANVGIISVVFDAGGQPTSILVAGEHDGPIAPFVCSYLES